MTSPAPSPTLEPYALRVEHLENPCGLDEHRPRFAWRLRAAVNGERQGAYRITVTAPGGMAWDSGKIASADQFGIEYAGAGLSPFTRYDWTLEVWNADDQPVVAAQAWFETGRMGTPWQAAWIGRDRRDRPAFLAPVDNDLTWNTRELSAPSLLRHEFDVPDGVVSARLHVSAQGLYQARLNGSRVHDTSFNPGWTDYRHRIQYQTYDVTNLVTPGRNAIGAVLADGWWCGFVGYDPRNAGKLYGKEAALLAELHVVLADGSTLVVATDDTWRESAGEWLYADLLMGEGVDARRREEGWDGPAFLDGHWRTARALRDDTSAVVSTHVPPVRTVLEVPAVTITPRDDGSVICDFGQNLVGSVRLSVNGARAGEVIELVHGEILDDDGSIYVENLRRAEARDLYYPRGDASEVFEPQFTFHGFRYVGVKGLPAVPTAEDVTAMVVSSDLEEVGDFRCDNPDVQQIISNTRWSQRGNFLSVPTDCPQRDERLGWLADAQVFAPTAARFNDISAFMANWMRDVVLGQSPEGAFPDIAPAGPWMGDGAPAWGDAGVIIPMMLHTTYGDLRQLGEFYPAMTRWVDYVGRSNPDLVWRKRVGSNYGDWLHTGPETSREMLATAYFAHSASLVARAALLLGHADDAARYTSLAEQIRQAFLAEFVRDGVIESDTQTAYLLALDFDLLPEEMVPDAVARLVSHVEQAGRRLTTGFIGVSKICRVLSAHGRDDLAHALLVQDEFPSWLFPIRHGATTIWERWDGWTPEGGFQSANMNSFNHYSLGAVVDWIHAGLGGIDQAPGSVGYRNLVVRVRPGAGVTEASCSEETVLGRVATQWTLRDGVFTLHVEVPPGATAIISLPTTDPAAVTGAPAPLQVGSDGALEYGVAGGRHAVQIAGVVSY